MCRHAGFRLGGGWGELGWGKGLAAQELVVAAVGESGSVHSCCLFCVFSLSVSLSLLFPLFAVLLNGPFPDPPAFCLFLSILLRTPEGRGAAAWRFCYWPQPNYNIQEKEACM